MNVAVPVGVLMVNVFKPVATPAPTVRSTLMVSPPGVTPVMVAVIPAGAVIPVAPTRLRPTMVSGMTVPRTALLLGDTLVTGLSGVTVMFVDAPIAIPVLLA